MENSQKVGLIADDFTGALDAGAQFFSYRYISEESLWNVSFRLSGVGIGDVEIINTNSREIPEPEAALKAKAAAGLLSGRVLFKKIDSTLRGNIAVEVKAVMDAVGKTKAVLCPAIPSQGRTVVDGILLVNGIPIADTSFSNDPVWPAKTSFVPELLRSECGYVKLEVVREGVEAVISAIQNSSEAIIAADAETDADLGTLARAIFEINGLPCGAFGLAKAFVGQLPFLEHTHAIASENYRKPCLVLVGSANQVSRDQVDTLLTYSGVKKIRLPSQPGETDLSKIKNAAQNSAVIILAAEAAETIRTEEWMSFGSRLAAFSLEVLRSEVFRSIFVIGGETLSAFAEYAKAESIQITGELLPGIPSGVIHGGELSGYMITTKAGGFGDKFTLVKILIGK